MRELACSAVIVALLHGSAFADPERAAAAIALFDEGRALVARGEFQQACEKFEAARTYSPTPWVGIALNLADCYEHLGRTASAWVLFREVADLAARNGDARAAYASDRAGKLEGRLAFITIAESSSSGLRISLDGRDLPPGTTSTPLPIDPGPHIVVAEADGFERWSTSIEGRAGATVAIVVPVLARADPRRPVSATPRSIEEDGPRTRGGLALAVGGAGIVALAASLVMGRKAMSLRDRALDGHCTATFRCDGEGTRLVELAQDRGIASTVTAVVGVGAVLGAVVIYKTSPRTRALVPLAGPSVAGLAYNLSW